MKIESIVSEIRKKQSFLCIGLDVDLSKIPLHLLKTSSPIFEFNKAIIDATHHLCVAYKPNIAFYEAYGQDGWKALKQTIDYLNDNYPWDGYLYDCDFNQMLGLKVKNPITHIRDFNARQLQERTIQISQHCYGCTAGAGSSCQGTVV